jgi:ribosomal protein L11 methyltransferase
MAYRIDFDRPGADVVDRLIELGALDVDVVDGHLAAILPDHVTTEAVARITNDDFRVSAARARDGGAVWILAPRPVTVGSVVISPADRPKMRGHIRLTDSDAFGTGLHPTTALCLDMLSSEVRASRPKRVLDVGTGSGVLALAALELGVPQVTAIDIDPLSIRIAAENARLNDASGRLQFAVGGPDLLSSQWPLVLANILAAPLMDMAASVTRRVARRGRLILSGIPISAVTDIERVYRAAGMTPVRRATRGPWVAVVLHASW